MDLTVSEIKTSCHIREIYFANTLPSIHTLLCSQLPVIYCDYVNGFRKGKRKFKSAIMTRIQLLGNRSLQVKYMCVWSLMTPAVKLYILC